MLRRPNPSDNGTFQKKNGASRLRDETMPQPQGSKGKVTIIEIADAAGVSKSTVSLVLTGRGSVKPETRQQVLQTMDRLGYVYNRQAGQLRAGSSNTIAVVINALMNPFFAEILVAEVARTLDDPTPLAVEEELIAIGLMKYVGRYLSADWRTSGKLIAAD